MWDWLFKKKTVKREITPENVFGELITALTQGMGAYSTHNLLSIPAVNAASKIMAEKTALFTIQFFRDTGEYHTEEPDYFLAKWLNYKANTDQSAFNVKTKINLDAILEGNGYGYILQTKGGDFAGIMPIHNARVAVQWAQPDEIPPEKSQLKYEIDGKPVDSARMIHITGAFTRDGSIGIPMAEYAQNTLAFSRALDAHGVKYFQNNSIVGNNISIPDTPMWTPDKITEYMEARRKSAGVENAYADEYLPAGVVKTPNKVSNTDGEFIPSKQHTFLDACRFTGNVPPTLICDLGGAGFQNGVLDATNKLFAQYSLLPLCQKWIDEIRMKLIPEQDQDKYCVRFNMDDLTKASPEDRTAQLFQATGKPWQTVNETRKIYGLDPVEGGDELGNPAEPKPNPVDPGQQGDGLHNLLGQASNDQ